MLVVIRGAGDIATGVALRLHRAGMRVVMCDLPNPTSIRRTVCFSEAIRLGETRVEGVRGVLCADAATASTVARAGDVAVLVDPEVSCVAELAPDALVDAILAKRNLGTRRGMAPVVVGVGPGFTAPVDCDAAVETMRGHYLGRVYYEGSPLPNTAVPGLIGGYAGERVMRAPADGVFEPCVEIGATVRAGDVCARVAGEPMRATIDGVVRGLLQAGVRVTTGMKSGDVDPRCPPEYIETSADKALAVGGGVLEAILALSGGAADDRGEKNDAPVLGDTFSDQGFVSALRDELAAGRRVALASLLATRGSMPRHEGARLAVLEDGRMLGTVGGGNVERVAESRARALLAGEKDARLPDAFAGQTDRNPHVPGNVQLPDASAAETDRSPHAPALEWLTRDANDMACGGDALLAVRTLTPDDLPTLEALLDALGSRGAATLEELWADPSAPELRVVTDARLAPRASWDEASATYREPVMASATCHVFGAGHVGTALVPLAASIGYEVAVYDDRPEAADPARLPSATSVSCGSFADLAAEAKIGSHDAVVVLTHGHAADETVLLAVLAREARPAYVGCIGSRRKAVLARARLEAAGIPAERVASVHLPIGENILAVTPQEIAVSIAAQLIRCRAGWRTQGEGTRS